MSVKDTSSYLKEFSELLNRYNAGTITQAEALRKVNLPAQMPHTKEEIIAEIDRESKIYISYRVKPQVVLKQLELMLRHLNLEGKERILSIGYGPGLFETFIAGRLLNNGGYVVGVDLSVELLKIARRIAKKERVRNVDFRFGDAEKLYLIPENDFDHMVSISTIHLIPDCQTVISQVRSKISSNDSSRFILTYQPDTANYLWNYGRREVEAELLRRFSLVEKGTFHYEDDPTVLADYKPMSEDFVVCKPII